LGHPLCAPGEGSRTSRLASSSENDPLTATERGYDVTKVVTEKLTNEEERVSVRKFGGGAKANSKRKEMDSEEAARA